MASLRRRAEEARWHTASQVLAWLRLHPGGTRAALAQDLQLTSGLATELTGRMRALRLLAETPAPPQGRGRPTTVLTAHPDGPVVLAVELRMADWRHATAGLDGRLHSRGGARHASREPEAVLAEVRKAVENASERYGDRLCAVSLAVAGTTHDGRLAQSATLGWRDVDLTTLTSVPLLLGNDALLAGLAEARTGAAVGAAAALHLMVEVGIGGAFTVDGRPSGGAHGAAGEYGHQPYGDRSLSCPCGARGCWDLDVDGRALARHLGAAEPADPRGYAREILRRADPAARQALDKVAAALGAGIGALVNVHDPDTVTLGGLAAPLRAAAPETFATTYTSGLMAFRRGRPPAVIDAAHGDDGALQGAALLALDHVTSEAALASWSARQP
ncbi:ROK family protein [Actinoplanes friuliensis]|uniref:ROK family protein n=1 Tax=Actinoplanes friuliensis DSM 7358 TaxID=1246995 RepID=U5W9G6_9ACTN|nr:ROK family protein [Actinoplanes friuliensis]AGZ44546.1 ROK family protein [Actinoplanes friuliensis DSM 7358]